MSAQNKTAEATLSMRPATGADVDALLALRKDTMLPHLNRAGAPSDEQSLLARVTFRLEDAQLVFLGDEMVGLFKAYRTGQEWMLVQIQIAPQRQGQGLGEVLIRQLLARAAAEDCTVVLNVLKDNPARKLYERLGFSIENEGDLEYQMRWAP